MNLKSLIKVVSTVSIALTALAITISVKSLNEEANKADNTEQQEKENQ